MLMISQEKAPWRRRSPLPWFAEGFVVTSGSPTTSVALFGPPWVDDVDVVEDQETTRLIVHEGEETAGTGADGRQGDVQEFLPGGWAPSSRGRFVEDPGLSPCIAARKHDDEESPHHCQLFDEKRPDPRARRWFAEEN